MGVCLARLVPGAGSRSHEIWQSAFPRLFRELVLFHEVVDDLGHPLRDAKPFLLRVALHWVFSPTPGRNRPGIPVFRVPRAPAVAGTSTRGATHVGNNVPALKGRSSVPASPSRGNRHRWATNGCEISNGFGVYATSDIRSPSNGAT